MRVRSPANVLAAARLLGSIDDERVELPHIELPARPQSTGYIRPPRDTQRYVPDHAATLLD